MSSKMRGFFTLSYAAMAEEMGVKKTQIQLIPKRYQTLGSIVQYVGNRALRASIQLTDAEAAAYLVETAGSWRGGQSEEEWFEVWSDRWANRWPRFDLYRCGVAGCEEVSIQKGVCRKCGGSRPSMVLKKGEVLIAHDGNYVKLLHIVGGAAHGFQVYRLDRNPLNLHPANLVLHRVDKQERVEVRPIEGRVKLEETRTIVREFTRYIDSATHKGRFE